MNAIQAKFLAAEDQKKAKRGKKRTQQMELEGGNE
jgi:hypothetical protein